jgi:hypothetical protein
LSCRWILQSGLSGAGCAFGRAWSDQAGFSRQIGANGVFVHPKELVFERICQNLAVLGESGAAIELFEIRNV